MAQIRVTMTLNLDEEALAAHDEDKAPPPDIEDWYDSDVFDAHDAGIVETQHVELESIEKV